MANLDTDILGEHLGIVKGALLALGAPIEAVNSLKWIRDQFETVHAGSDTGPLAQFEQASKPVPKGNPMPQTVSAEFTEDGFFKGSASPAITPIDEIPARTGRKEWSPEAKAAQAERQKARWAARKEAGAA